MDYKKIYYQIVDRAKNRKLDEYKETHHIIPKCIGGSNKAENLVELTAKEHFLCHMLLCEIYPDEKKLTHAFWLMVIGRQKTKKVVKQYKVSSRAYERARIAYIKSRKGSNISDKHKSNISKKNSKKVYQFDLKGKFIKEWNSHIEAERSMKNNFKDHWSKLPSNISAACKKRQKTSYGFLWSHEKDFV